MKTLAVITLTALFLTSATKIFAQDSDHDSHDISISIPDLALLDLEGGTSITLSPALPSEAGDPFSFTGATDNSTWVNYSSIVPTGKARRVTAAITSGSVPAGLALKVTAGSYSGSGKGTLGTSAGQVTLSSTAQDIITGIGSCYTGNGTSNGHNLTYALDLTSVDDYSQLEQTSATVTVTYTITDAE